MRGDLSPGLQLAQVAHVATEYALRFPDKAKSTPIGVVLEASDEDSLLDWADRLHFADAEDWVLFHDPDVGDGEHTAIATVCTGEQFSALPLAGRAMAEL